MSDLTIFGQRCKIVRLGYRLSLEDAACILNTKSRATIFRIEKSINFPSIELLNRISNIFSLSLDWLFGKSETVYLESHLLQNEVSLLKIIDFINRESTTCKLLKEIPFEYLNENERRKHYSLPVRANILFLLYCFLLSYLVSSNNLGLLTDEACEFIQTAGFLDFSSYNSGNFIANFLRQDEHINALHTLLDSREQDIEPIFDFE